MVFDVIGGSLPPMSFHRFRLVPCFSLNDAAKIQLFP